MTELVIQGVTASASAMPSTDCAVFEYGVRLDADAEKAANDQIVLARRLYNALVEIMQGTVAELKDFLLEQAGDEARQVATAIDTLNGEFKEAKASNDEAAMKRIAAIRREQWSALSALLKKVRAEHKAHISATFLSRIGNKATCLTYQMRCRFVDDGLGWGTANQVLEAALGAWKKRFAKGQAPHFARGNEIQQDSLTLQFTTAGGARVESLMAGTQSDIAMLVPREGAGRRRYGEFRFRLGAAKANVVATGTWQYHRPIPSGSAVSIARLVRKTVGQKRCWYLQLLVKPPGGMGVMGEQVQRKPLAVIHFGWALLENGRRVIASLSDSADPGEAFLIFMPLEVEAGLDRAAMIQSERDAVRDELVLRIRQEFADMDGEGALVDLLGTIRRTQPQWVSANRLHYLCALLRAEERLPEWLEAWRQQDKLRWQDQVHIARRSRLMRRDFYREVAVKLARHYDAIALDAPDLSEAAQKVNEVTGEKSDLSSKARSGRVVVALFELISAIRWAAAKHESAVIELSGETASHCSVCGGDSLLTSESDHQTQHCSDCGAVLERKRNASALGWQLLSPVRESLVEEFWLLHAAKLAAIKAKKDMKREKMSEGRKAVRAARTGSDD